MKKNGKWIRILPVLLCAALLAAIWIVDGGREKRSWNDMQTYMTFYQGFERTGEAYADLNEGPGLTLPAGTYRLSWQIETDEDNLLSIVADNPVDISPDEIMIKAGESEGSAEFTLLSGADNVQFIVRYNAGSYIRVNQLSLVGNAYTDSLFTVSFFLIACCVLYVLWLCGKLTPQRRGDLVLIGVAVLIASMPVFKSHLNLGHDMRFHIERLMNLTSGLRMGQFPVRVGGYMCNGYGAITSVFYPELFLYPSALMMLMGASVNYAVHTLLLSISVVSAVCMYLCAKRMFGRREAACAASILYTLALFRLVDLYTRSALGEALAMAFMPLLAWGLWEVFVGDKRRWPLLALGAAAICHSHVISTAMIAVLCVGLGVLFFVPLMKARRLGAVFCAVGAAILLCVCWMLPMAQFAEQGITTDVMLSSSADNAIAPAQLLMSDGTSLSQGVFDPSLRHYYAQIGFALLLGAVAALYAALTKQKMDQDDRLVLFLTALGICAALMSTTLFPWGVLDSITNGLIGYIQFPWRLLTITTVCFALVGGYGFTMLFGEHRASIAALAIASLCALPMLTEQTRSNDYIHYGRNTQPGLLYMDYALEGTNLQETKDRTVHILGDAQVDEYEKYGTSVSLSVSAKTDAKLTLPLFAFKGYEAKIDEEPVEILTGENNRIMIDLPAGTSGTLRVTYAGQWLWRVGDCISFVTLMAMMGYCAVMRKKWRT